MAERSVSEEVETSQNIIDNAQEPSEEQDNFIEAIMSEIRPAVAYWNKHYAELYKDAEDYSGSSGDEIITSLPYGTHYNPIPYNERSPLFRKRNLLPILTRIKVLFGRLKGITQSGYFLVVLFSLLAVPITYLYMGAVYFEECDYVNHYPIMFLFMSLSSFIMIAACIFRFFLVKYVCKEWFTLIWFNAFALIQFSMLAVYQAVSLLMVDYAALSSDPTCHPLYYDFVWWNEWIAPSLVLFLIWYR